MNRRRFLSRVALAGALLADLFLQGDPVSHHGLSQEAFAAAAAAQDRYTPSLLGIPGVVGTAIGLGSDGQPVVKVYLSVVGVAALPAALDGITLVPEVTGPFRALAQEPSQSESDGNPVDPRSHFPRPVPIGVSSGQANVTAGTIGARVTNGTEVFALSNNHVFAASNDARIGDNIIQPGIRDGGRDPDHAIGTLADFEPIRFCGSFPLTCPENLIDAAIASTTTDNLQNETPPNGYGVPRSDPVEARLNQQVQKYGRTTGLTQGFVSGIRATVNVGYRGRSARFVNQIIVSGFFSQGGDSGSLIVTRGRGGDDRRPVGLLFAGGTGTTIANPIGPVLDRFGVSVDGG